MGSTKSNEKSKVKKEKTVDSVASEDNSSSNW